MKLALVVPGGVDRSGEYRVIPALLWLIGRLSREHEVRVFALHQEPQPDRWPLRGAQVENIGRTRTLWRTVSAIRREHARAPFDVIHAFWGGTGAWAARIAARRLRVPVLVHLAGGELVAFRDIGYGGGRNAWQRLQTRWLLRGVDRVTAASQPMVEQAARLGIDVARVPLGVDLDEWPVAAPRARAPGEMARLIHVASLNRIKDQSTLLKALAQMPASCGAFRLDIVGEDTLAGEVQALCGTLGIGQCVEFHGFLTQRQLRPLMEAAHVHLVSSLHEAGPLAVLEAAVAGVPTVGTAVGHLAEWSPEAALAVTPGDAAALAGALGRVLADDGLRMRLATRAAALSIGMDVRNTAAEFVRLYGALR